jgi:hypothetical protein
LRLTTADLSKVVCLLQNTMEEKAWRNLPPFYGNCLMGLAWGSQEVKTAPQELIE